MSARIAVVVPAFCEERFIGRVIQTIPEWVERVFVVDDASPDATYAAAMATGDPRLTVVRHEDNRGVGAAIVSGYQAARAAGATVIAVMAGDGQMDPADLRAVVEKVAAGEADYVKGNRFVHGDRRRMPLHRRIAGRALAFATRLTTGVAIDDSQCGYTAISAEALGRIPLHDVWPRYGYPNDLLALLARANCRIAEVPVRPIYADEASGIRPWHAIVILGLLTRRALQRL